MTGRIAGTVAESVPWWEPKTPRVNGAPNIVVVLLDDTGWSDFGCFGSEIRTPSIDALADAGVRFNNFHVTPLCSPTRSSLLTGKNHHSVGMRFLAVGDSGFPNARGELPRDVQTVPAVLRERGYGTYMVGKWHLAPQDELGPAGPFHNWPLARGYDRFYGFLGGASDQYLPELYRDNSPATVDYDPEYHVSADLVDNAIRYLTDHVGYRGDDPFYLQLAFGATHAPLQVPGEWVDGYRGQYDDGWDRTRARRHARQQELGVTPKGTQLAERDDAVPAWDDLSEDERALAARAQETYAGFLEHTDAQIGRLVGWLERNGQLENTIIAVFSDNGAAGDGRELGTTNVIGPYNNLQTPAPAEQTGLEAMGDKDHPAHYATGWAMAGNTPFRLYKQFTDLGGTRSPLIVRTPDAASAGEVRDQFAHVIDLAATFVDGAVAPDDEARATVLAELDGASLHPVLSDADASAPRQTQYFEMLGHRAIWHEGWHAVTRHVKGTDYDDDRWRLYRTGTDFAEAVDLAEQEPDRLRQLVQTWWTEAEQHGVLPLDDRTLKELLVARSEGARPLAQELTLRPGQSHLGFTTRLTGTNRAMHVTARLRRTPADDGVILASGASYGGYILYLDGDDLIFEHRMLDEHVVIRATRPVGDGATTVGFALSRGEDRAADVELLIDGHGAGNGHLPTTSMQLAFYGLDIGRDRSARVLASGRPGRPFLDGALEEITILFDAAAENLTHLSHNLEANE